MKERNQTKKKPNLRALEKNILKYRAIQMILVIFEAEQIRNFVITSIEMTTEIFNETKHTLPKNQKEKIKHAWKILTNEGVITEKQSKEIQKIIDHRNDIAHRISHLVSDITIKENSKIFSKEYDYQALDKLESIKKSIYKNIGRKFCMPLPIEEYLFDEARNTYKEELGRLHKKITRQMKQRIELIKHQKD